MRIGIRELRNNLRKCLEQVRAGDEIVVTNRGRAVARLVPADGVRVFDQLIAEGKVTPARPGRLPPLPKPIRTKNGATVSDLVIEQRR